MRAPEALTPRVTDRGAASGSVEVEAGTSSTRAESKRAPSAASDSSIRAWAYHHASLALAVGVKACSRRATRQWQHRVGTERKATGRAQTRVEGETDRQRELTPTSRITREDFIPLKQEAPVPSRTRRAADAGAWGLRDAAGPRRGQLGEAIATARARGRRRARCCASPRRPGRVSDTCMRTRWWPPLRAAAPWGQAGPSGSGPGALHLHLHGAP